MQPSPSNSSNSKTNPATLSQSWAGAGQSVRNGPYAPATGSAHQQETSLDPARRRGPGSGTSGIGRPTRVLLWVAGADPAKLPTRLERYRAASIGVFVVLIALLAASALSLYVTVVAGRFSPWFLIPALFWGVVVFWVDRSILIEPNYGNLDAVEDRVDTNLANGVPAVELLWPPKPAPDNQQPAIPPYRPSPGVLGGTTRWLFYGSRLGMALAIAYLISEVLVLLIFRPEITRETTRVADETYLAEIQKLATQESAALEPQITALGDEIKAQDKALETAKQAVKDARDKYDLEVSGNGLSGTAGPGQLTSAEWANYQHAQQNYDAAIKAHDDAVAKDNAAIQQLQQRRADLATPASAAFIALEISPRGRALHDQIYVPAGWLAQEQAFRRFQQSSGDSTTAVVPWVIRGLLVLIDLLPLSLKLLNSYTLYGRGVRDEAMRIRHRDRRQLIFDLRQIDHHAQLEDYLDGQALRQDYDNRNTYYHTRADHLRR